MINVSTTSKPRWQFPGVFGLIKFALTGRWKAPVQEEEEAPDHSRFADRLGRTLALPMFVVFSVGGLLSVVQDPITRNLTAYFAAAPINVTDVVAVIITFFLFGYGDITMVSAAGTFRDAIANRKPWHERIFPAFLVLVIAVLESVAFGGLIYRLEHPDNIAGWVSLIGRSSIGPLCVIWFAISPKRMPTQEEMNQRLIYRLAQARETILKGINLAASDSLAYLPIIEQMRLWLDNKWDTATQKKTQDFMTLLEKLAPSASNAAVMTTGIEHLQAMMITQQQLTTDLDQRQQEQQATMLSQLQATVESLRDYVDNALTSVPFTDEESPTEIPSSMNSGLPVFRTASGRQGPPSPTSTKFAKWVYQQAQALKTKGFILAYPLLAQQINTLFSLNHDSSVYEKAINDYRAVIIDTRGKGLPAIMADSVFSDLDKSHPVVPSQQL